MVKYGCYTSWATERCIAQQEDVSWQQKDELFQQKYNKYNRKREKMTENYAVTEIEKARKKCRFFEKVEILIVVYMFAIPLVALFVFKKTSIDSRSPEALLLGAEYIAGFVCMMVVFCAADKEVKKIKKLYKAGFVTAVLSERIPGAVYKGNKGFLEPWVKNFNIIQMDNVFYSEDYIKAEYQGICYEHADVTIEHQFSRPRATNMKIFKGRMLRFRGLSGQSGQISFIGIYSHTYKHRAPLKMRENPETGKKQMPAKYSCKDEDFDRSFEVYAMKDEELLTLMTPGFMQLLKTMLQRYFSIALVFEDNNLYMALGTDRDTFDVEMAHKVDLQKERERIHRDIQDIEDVIDVLGPLQNKAVE